MRKLIKECAPWLSWKVAAIFVAVVICIGLIVGANVGLLAIVSATPLLAMVACLVPCLIPLMFLRRKKEPVQTTTPITGTCSCGSDMCTVGSGTNSCQTQISLAADKHN